MLSLQTVVDGVRIASEPRLQLPAALANLPITGACIDSREASADGLFVALQGERVDGHDFIAAAAARGVRAALVQRGRLADPSQLGLDRPFVLLDPDQGQIANDAPANAFFLISVDLPLAAMHRLATRYRQQQDLVVVGITGSVGKTSTKEVLAAMLAPTMRTHKSPRSYNSENTLPLVVLGIEPEHQIAVLEMGIYNKGDLALLTTIAQPQIGIVTNVGASHLERMHTIENVAEAKSELVQALPADGWAILNYDDQRVRAMQQVTKAQVFTYGLDPEADLWADNIESRGLDGIGFDAHYRGEQWHIKLPLIGLHSVHTALAAAAVGIVLGLSWDSLIQGLRSSAQLRLLSYPAVGGATLIDDTYNASPVSCIAALNLLAELQGRRIAVFGDMAELGPHDESGHRLVGVRAADVVDQLYVVGEKARWIGEEAIEVGLPAEQVHVLPNKAAVIAALQSTLQANDYVLVKGSRAAAMEDVANALQVRPEATA
ncbi:UDP-N-acetylmuramoyl-tripeptide--D-alanyl-D-alanine ligase [Herpetosiphon gulosus]|uniref:UDP-N-acetylmuramoyl-tripeptide--D-alanyl-D-alanine ligase n=1 Tax=Herpetosiphon gulosus TaxID=1973496 RepID=A0ABP9WVF1_9CHLR